MLKRTILKFIHMTPFLKQIASLFYKEYKANISDFCFVFPNRRSGLFFQKYLSEEIETPLFSPEICTITEFFAKFSPYQIEDKFGLIFRLYGIYKKISCKDESLDNFLSFGEVLINDFDDIDKYLVDAKDLFQNVKDLQDINYLPDYLEEAQKDAIRKFWKNFNPQPKRQQEFLATWEILYPLYTEFKQNLRKNNIAYEGMLFRDVCETAFKIPYQKVIFIGFNAISSAERRLFTLLKNQNIGDFYWDYNSDFVQDKKNKADFFVKDNLFNFPSQLSLPKEHNPLKNKQIQTISIPSNVGQTKEVYAILKELSTTPIDTETAIVLSDEKLLFPMLYSIPEEIEKINVTMGYALNSTPIKELIDNLVNLQKNITKRKDGDDLFYYKPALAILNHRYIYSYDESNIQLLINNITQNNKIKISKIDLNINEFLSLVFSPKQQNEICFYLMEILSHLISNNNSEDNDGMVSNLEKEFLFQAYTSIKRMNDLLQKWQVEIDIETLARLVKRLISNISIPFQGEPLAGLQIMGMLETRCLDFKNLIITSFNEGIFPKNDVSPSFIPHNLRKGFGLPTTEHQDAIFSYHFYRLIERAENIYLLYDTRTENLNSGEKSRFINQLRYGYNLNIPEKTVTYNTSIKKNNSIEIAKTEPIMAKLSRFLSKSEHEKAKSALSATAINDYINCSLKFYFSYVEGIKQTDELSEEVAENQFGSIFHYVMENIFKPFEGKTITHELLSEMQKNKAKIEKETRKGFSRYYYKNDQEIELKGNNYLIAQIILKYVIQLLDYDKAKTPFLYITSEKKCEENIFVKNINSFVSLKGYIDRVEMKEGIINIYDYKTGKGELNYKDFSTLFDKNFKDRKKDVLQVLIYAWLYKTENKTKEEISTNIYYLRKLFSDNFSVTPTPENQFSILEEDFMRLFTNLLSEIFDENIPFAQTKCKTHCNYCPFKQICQ